jgi:hypothetical protein
MTRTPDLNKTLFDGILIEKVESSIPEGAHESGPTRPGSKYPYWFKMTPGGPRQYAMSGPQGGAQGAWEQAKAEARKMMEEHLERAPTNIADAADFRDRSRYGAEYAEKYLLSQRTITEDMTRTSPKAQAMIQALGHEMAEETRGSGFEVGCYVDNDTGEVTGGVLEGSKDGIIISASHTALHADRGYTQMHTHPTSLPPSPDDLGVFVNMPQTTRMAIFGANGTSYVLEKPHGWSVENAWEVPDDYEYQEWMGDPKHEFRVIQLRYNKIRHDLTPKYIPEANPDGSRDKERDHAAFMEHSNEVMEILAEEFGFTYRRIKPDEA